MIHCVECGERTFAAICYPVGDCYICDNCAEKIRDVAELSAALGISMYDLVAAVID